LFFWRINILNTDALTRLKEHSGMYDDLMENDPEMIRLREKWRAEGRAEGLARETAKGERKALCAAIITVVKVWFPSLEKQAQQKVSRMRSNKNLWHLFEQLVNHPDEATASILLTKNNLT
jgi:hypothetical protein